MTQATQGTGAARVGIGADGAQTDEAQPHGLGSDAAGPHGFSGAVATQAVVDGGRGLVRSVERCTPGVDSAGDLQTQGSRETAPDFPGSKKTSGMQAPASGDVDARVWFFGTVAALLARSAFAHPSRWSRAVVILRTDERRVTSRADFASWLGAVADLRSSAREVTNRRIAAGSVLVWVELDTLTVAGAELRVVDLLREIATLRSEGALP